MTKENLAPEKLETEIQRIKAYKPMLSNILNSFEKIMLTKNSLKSELLRQKIEIEGPDMDKLAAGVPALSDKDAGQYFSDIDMGASRMLEALAKAFPNISLEVGDIQSYITSYPEAPKKWLNSLILGNLEIFADLADNLDIDTETMRFIVEQCLKPYLETLSVHIAPHLEKMHWDKGFCPICGTYPDTTYLQQPDDKQEYLRAHGGQRWLHCALCSHEWRLRRIVCPYCGNEEDDSLEYLHAEDMEHERIYVCHECNKYITCIDTSQLVDIPPSDLLPFELLPMDFVAQEMGYLPLASNTWNYLEG